MLLCKIQYISISLNLPYDSYKHFYMIYLFMNNPIIFINFVETWTFWKPDKCSHTCRKYGLNRERQFGFDFSVLKITSDYSWLDLFSLWWNFVTIVDILLSKEYYIENLILHKYM